ncbi:MAG: type III pantothenate kinase [Cycloclasticus sp. symbiont of Bathymodiolus heckerae]|nr:MAG: type III pantothenate kinase [Cycloclasticus sp. symbiont of Bathymodiolus heckerae]
MPQLYIDRGNTALKWQVLDGSMVLNEGTSCNELSISDALTDVSEHCLSGIYVSSVGSNDFADDLLQWAKQYQQPEPKFVESTAESCGVVNVYAKPNQLGVDRWLALIAAHHQYKGMLCIVDSGTAMTMDFILGNGRHLGGFIVPGAALMRRSLLSSTQKIKVGDVTRTGQLGECTSEAVVFGIEFMLQSFVQAKVLKMKEEYQQDITVVLTGGHANTLADGLGSSAHVKNDLVLQGLQYMFSQSQ